MRSYNCLKREGVHTVGELVSRTESDLLDIRNFGQKSIDEVKVKLHQHGSLAQGQRRPPSIRPSLKLAYSDNGWSDDSDDSSARRRVHRGHRL